MDIDLTGCQENKGNITVSMFDICLYDEFIMGILQGQMDDGKSGLDVTLKRVTPVNVITNGRNMNKRSMRGCDVRLGMFIRPFDLRLVLCEDWKPEQLVTLGTLIANHFRARSTRKLRFEHKLWNALALTARYPELIDIIGISWETKDILRVDRDAFGSLLGLTRPTAALFNPQGSLQSHGFQEVNFQAQKGDTPSIRYFRHTGGFNSSSSQDDLMNCKWIVNRGQAEEVDEPRK